MDNSNSQINFGRLTAVFRSNLDGKQQFSDQMQDIRMAISSFQTRVLFGVQIATLMSMVGGWGVKNPKLNLNFLLIFFEINLFPKRMQAPIEQKRLPNCLFRI